MVKTHHDLAPFPYVRGREYQTDSWDMFAVSEGSGIRVWDL